MPKFVDLATNAPPVDPSLVKTNIIPTFRDVAPPRFVDDEPKKAPIELLAEKIDTQPKFVPSDEQLDEYFDYKDKQPFSFSKVRDFAVNTVGALITDVGKAVASAANDPDFVLGPGTRLIGYLAGGADPEKAAKATLAGPAKRAVTTAEAAARGTWDLSILGRQLTDKMEELNKDSWSGWADFAVEEHNKKYPKNKITKTGLYYDGYKEINPGDLQKLKAKWGNTKNQARRDAWRTMRYMINTRANAAEGKQTILSEFFDKDVDKALRPFINNNVAEGGSYVLDASAPVGFLAAPMKAGAKAPVTSLLVTKTGEMVKAGGKKAENAAELLSSKFKSLQDEIIETELPQPKQIGALETGARIFTVAGDGLEALGRSAGQPRTLESTLERAGRTAETQAARKALKTASKVDPLLDTVGSLVSGAKAGTLSGLALTLPTGDEEMIGGAIGSGSFVGGAGGLAGGFTGKKQITQKQVENTVNEWLSSKSPEEKQNIQKLGLTPAEAGNVAVAELLGRGIIGKDKLSDVNFVYLSQDDYLKRFHPEVLVDGKAPADTPFGTRGAQSSVDGTPTVFINTGYNGARSIFHELMHGLLRFDELQGSRAELRSYLFDSKTPDGEVIKKGWFEDGDLDAQFDAYLTMLPEESSAPFLEQFNVYKDVETESGPQRVIDEEATRDRQREYIMEELEAESFANFIQRSGPTFLQQTRSISQKLLDRWFLQDNIRKTGIMKAILGRSGVEFGADGNPTGLFYRDGKPFTNSPELNKLIRDFVRAKDTVNKRMVEDDAGERPAMTIGGRQAKAGRKQIEAAIKSKDGAKIVQHFQNNDIFARDQSGKIVYDVNGVPILLGRKEIEKLQANRREQIMDKLSEVGADPNGMVQDSNGSWRGVPTNKQLRAILEVPDSIIAPGMKDTIRDIARKFKTPGQSIIIDYNPALNKSGVYDSNLSSGLRIAVPLGFNVSKSGNFYMTTLDVGAMNMKMADWAKTGQLKSWDGDTKRFYQDVYKYLENHQKDVPGETGIGVDKRNIINDFFGVTVDNVNPITDARKAAEASMSPGKRSKAKASANLIRSRRFDRINRIEKNRVSKQAAGTPLPMKSQSDAYRKMQQNFMPGIPDTKRLIKRFIGDTRKDKVGISDKIIKDGQTVAVRIDIPTYNRSNEAVKRGELDSPVYAITFHNPGSKKDDGGYSVSYKKFKDQSGQEIASTLYEAVGAIKNPKFYQDEAGAEAIRSGERNKFPIATAEGQFIKNPKVPRDLSSFTEVGYNPEKHSYFYEKSTDRPVLEGDLAYFFGNTVYVKNPKFGSRSDFRFMPAKAEPRPAQDKLGFFSRVEQVASGNKIPNRGTGEQMLATIAKQPGVKQEEIAWLGLEDFLRGKKQVTKDELVEFIRENDVQLEETMLTETPPDDIRDELISDFVDQESDQYQILYDEDEKSYLTYDPNGEPMYMFGGDLVKHADPDGAMDDLKFKIEESANRMTDGELMQRLGRENVYQEGQPARYQEYQLPGAEPGSYRELLLRLPKPRGDKDFTSSHFSEPNILSHVRFNDRTGPDGEKILFLEELQSDWHQEGRKLGYATGDATPQATVLKANQGARLFYLYNFDGDLLGKFPTREEATEKAVSLGYEPVNEVLPNKLNKLVPDAPFKSSWHELTLKRMLRYAAENGYDKLAFIDGKETADRYDLSKKIDGLEVIDLDDGTYEILAKEVGDDAYRTLANNVEKDKVEDYIGKEVAKTAFDKMDDGLAHLEGVDLKVGGEWAFNLYDRMIPQFLNKYGKKFGAKVEDVEIRTNQFEEDAMSGSFESDAIEGESTSGEISSFKAIDITPQMRGEEGVLGGQVRFMPGIERVANNEPGLAAETVKIKPGALDGVRFMPGTKVPKITLEKIVESDPFIITADSMADMTYTVPDSGVEIKLHGGPMFSYRPGKAVWASNKGAASRIGNFVERTGQRFALIMLQNGTNHAKNKSMGQVFVEELKARSGAKKIKQGDLKKMLKFASDRAGLEKPIKNLAELEDFYAFWDWDTRGNFFQTFGLVRTPIGDPKKAGFFDYNQIVRDTTQPEFLDKPTGTIVGAIEFKSGKRFSAEELGAEPHSSYDTMLEGRGVGLFKNPPHISDVLDAPESQRSVFTLQKRLSSPNRLREAADAEKKLNAIRRHRNKNAVRNTKKAQ